MLYFCLEKNAFTTPWARRGTYCTYYFDESYMQAFSSKKPCEDSDQISHQHFIITFLSFCRALKHKLTYMLHILFSVDESCMQWCLVLKSQNSDQSSHQHFTIFYIYLSAEPKHELTYMCPGYTPPLKSSSTWKQ